MTGVRWWLNTDHGAFSVDNAAVNGIDCSSLDPTIWMVQWTDGKGEIERQVDKDTNDNGLRERFIDVVPYAPFFQQFLALCPRLTLTQAKKVDADLILEIFESKRQAPFYYPIAAGDYWWDASDVNMFSSLVPSLQNAIATLNSAISGINGLVASINAMSAALAAVVNSNVVTPGNNALSSVNTHLGNANTFFADPGNTLVALINNVFLNNDGVTNSINNKLQAPVIGLSAPLPHATSTWQYIGQNPYFLAGVGANAVSWSSPGSVPVSNTVWIPIGSSAPVTVTPTEAAAIIQGIAARTNDLNVKKNIKLAEVNALTDLQDVIDYDVTTGW